MSKLEELANKTYLFFSLDIFGATAFKEKDYIVANRVLIVMQHIINWEINNVNEKRLGFEFTLWKSLGDELIFIVEVSSIDMLEKVLDIAYNIIKKLSNMSTEDYTLYLKKHNKIFHLNTSKNKLTEGILNQYIKGSCWIIDLPKAKKLPQSNNFAYKKFDFERCGIFTYAPQTIHSKYTRGKGIDSNCKNKYEIFDFNGELMDQGFRISSKALPNTLSISDTIFYKLSKNDKNIDNVFCLDFNELKGVWSGIKYPRLLWKEYNTEDLLFELIKLKVYDIDVLLDVKFKQEEYKKIVIELIELNNKYISYKWCMEQESQIKI